MAPRRVVVGDHEEEEEMRRGMMIKTGVGRDETCDAAAAVDDEGGGIEQQHMQHHQQRYLIVHPERATLLSLLAFLLLPIPDSQCPFIQTAVCNQCNNGYKQQQQQEEDVDVDNDNDDQITHHDDDDDHRWVIVVSVIIRRIIAIFGKPMEWLGVVVEWVLNLVSLNGGGLLPLLFNLFKGKLVIPCRGSDTFISAIGHLDSRIDLYKGAASWNMAGQLCRENVSDYGCSPKIASRAMMDLCMMASKLAYENEKVVRNIVVHHWKMHFVKFYNCWDDYQKERSTQVFIICDKLRDANIILISFRGTEPFDADDWSTDFDYSWYDIPEMGRVHMGFLEALGLGNRAQASTSFQSHLLQTDRSNEDETTAYYAVRAELKRLLREHKNAKFVVTGHSLGGALAILLPAVLLLHREEEVMGRLLGVCTFGQPRVGDAQLEKFMEAHVCRPVRKYFRVVYCNDLVPRLPYDDLTFLYKHFGLCLYYDSFYIEQNMEEEPNRNYFGWRYLIPEYLNAVWELIRSLTMGYIYGPEYKETWCSIMLRLLGLAMPGISAHSPADYVNCIRLGRQQLLQMNY